MVSHQVTKRRSFVLSISRLVFMYDLCEHAAAGTLNDERVNELFNALRTIFFTNITLLGEYGVEPRSPSADFKKMNPWLEFPYNFGDPRE
jgi:hypothetical protein